MTVDAANLRWRAEYSGDAARGHVHTYAIGKQGCHWGGCNEVHRHSRQRPLGNCPGPLPVMRRQAMAYAEAHEAQILSRRGVGA